MQLFKNIAHQIVNTVLMLVVVRCSHEPDPGHRILCSVKVDRIRCRNDLAGQNVVFE